MQDKSNIDIKIREKLRNSTALMPDGLFENIMEAMPAAAPKKKAIVWFPYLLLGLGILLLILLLKTCDDNGLTNKYAEKNIKQTKKTAAEFKEKGESSISFRSFNNNLEQTEQNSTAIDASAFELSNENKQFISNLTANGNTNFDPGFLSISPDNFNPDRLLESVNQTNGSTTPSTPNQSDLDENNNLLSSKKIIVDRLPYKNLVVNPKSQLKEIKSNNLQSKFGVRLFGGPSLNYRTLRVDAYQDLENHRNAHEKAYSSFSFGAQLNFNLNNKIELFTGVQYMEVGEKYEFRHDTIEHITNNTYSYISIPVGIGYTLNQGKTFYSMVRAQLNTSFNNRAQASWIDPNSFSAVAHSDDAAHNPYRKVTFSGSLGMEFGVQLNKVKVFASPTLNYTFSNIYKSEEAINQHPFSGGLNFGLRFNL